MKVQDLLLKIDLNVQILIHASLLKSSFDFNNIELPWCNLIAPTPEIVKIDNLNYDTINQLYHWYYNYEVDFVTIVNNTLCINIFKENN